MARHSAGIQFIPVSFIGSQYTLTDQDINKTLEVNEVSDVIINVPSLTMVNGDFINVVQKNIGKIEFVEQGVIINAVDNIKITYGQHSYVSLIKNSVGFDLIGDLGISAPTGNLSVNTPNYFIKPTGSGGATAIAIASEGLTDISGDTYTVIQQAIDNLTPTGSQPHEGGGTIILSGLLNVSSGELVVNGWTGSQTTHTDLKIIGDGTAVISQNGSNKNIFKIQNKAKIELSNISMFVGADSLSAISFEKDVNQMSCEKATLKTIKVLSASTLAPAVNMVNFFGVQVDGLDIRNTAYTGLRLHNDSIDTNFGNSLFNNIAVLAPDNDIYSAIEISSSNSKIMNLNQFNVVNIGTPIYSPGQLQGVGIRINGGSFNTFTHIDIEYCPKSIVVEDGRSNYFLSGYIHPDGGTGHGIFCGANANSNKFEFLMEVDSNGTILIEDQCVNNVPNNYDITMSGFPDMNQIFITQRENTKLILRQNGFEKQTVELPETSVKTFKMASGAGSSKVLTSDVNGNGIWTDISTVIPTKTYVEPPDANYTTANTDFLVNLKNLTATRTILLNVVGRKNGDVITIINPNNFPCIIGTVINTVYTDGVNSYNTIGADTTHHLTFADGNWYLISVHINN